MSNEEIKLADPKYTLEAWLESDKFKRNITAVLPKHITPERFTGIALNILKRQPVLKECSQASFFEAMMKLSQIGLEPDGYHAHLIAFNNKIPGTSPPKYRKEIQLIVDYKGLITVIRRNPAIAVVKGNVVREGDDFLYEEGSARVFKHKPRWIKDAPILGAYSFVKYAQVDDWEVDFLPLWQIEEVRSRSRAKDNGPWVTNFAEMAIKTALRHHSKTLPLRAEERLAIAADDDQFEFDPFAAKRPALPMSAPEFTNEKKKEITDSAESGPEPAEQTGASTASSMVAEAPPAGDFLAKAHQGNPGGVSETAPAKTVVDPGAQLLAKINKATVTQDEVISVLRSHEIYTSLASESGLVADLPEATVTYAL